ncbi:MAG TPA: hypothetical protein VMC85_01515 [Desulfomonilaceae bacterium]|nr:hypothetical protein [Desulfomonilaceae bacterium]
MIGRINQMYESDRRKLLKVSETNVLVRSFLKLAWLHEACHVTAARLLGLEVYRFEQMMTTVEDGSNWKILIVVLAPAIIGVTGIVVCVVGHLLLSHSFAQDIIFDLPAVLGLSWLLACWFDFQDAWNILKS